VTSFKNTNDGRPVFFAGLRTPFTTAHRGGFKEIRPDDLLVTLMREHRARFTSIYDSEIDDVIVGCAYPEGEQGYNVARQASLGAGLSASGVTVNRLCGSSLEALSIASAQIAAGRGACYLVAGIESMSRIPRRGANFSESLAIRAASPDAYVTMGETAENVARKYPHLSRGIQEEFSARSHELAYKAWTSGFYNNDVMAVQNLRLDEAVRFPVNLEKMANLPPAFNTAGVVTAATSSPMSDGATCGFVTSISFAKEIGVQVALEVLDIQTAHVPPEIMGLGPVPAVQKILKRHDLKTSEISAVEMNEAFAIQVMACMDELDLRPEQMNAWGGALALGHPLGATGIRLMMTLQARMMHAGFTNGLGIASLCVGGGQGMAVLGRLIDVSKG
jgi:acetyl-CoA acyltransferase